MSEENAKSSSRVLWLIPLAVVVVIAVLYLVIGAGDHGDATTEPSEPANPTDAGDDAADFAVEHGEYLSWVRYTDAELEGIENPHEFLGRPLCQACHKIYDESPMKPVNALCKGCHDTAKHDAHPVDLVQKEPLPQDVRFGEGNKVICISCHEVHDLSKAPRGLRPDYAQICQDCHPGY